MSLTKELAHLLFQYEPDTGNLIWRTTKSPRAPVGSIAGSLHPNGYVYIQVNGKNYAAHQIVFLMHHGHIPAEIDHINRIKTDNRIENLRSCTSSQNEGNIGPYCNNTSGYRGVSLNKRSGFYYAQISINGKRTYLGRFVLARDAALAYNKAAIDQFGEFAYLNEVS